MKPSIVSIVLLVLIGAPFLTTAQTMPTGSQPVRITPAASGAMPDLVFDTVADAPIPGNAQRWGLEGGLGRIKFKLKNVGNLPAVFQVNQVMVAGARPRSSNKWIATTITVIKPGEWVEKSWFDLDIPCPRYKAGVTFEAAIDPDNVVAESNETNNVWSHPAQNAIYADEIKFAPSITITALTMTSVTPSIYDALKFEATVKNSGLSPVWLCHDKVVPSLSPAQAHPTQFYGLGSAANEILAPGATTVRTVEIGPTVLAAGNYQLQVSASKMHDDANAAYRAAGLTATPSPSLRETSPNAVRLAALPQREMTLPFTVTP